MTAAKKLQFISVNDYLSGELISLIKHEYVAGVDTQLALTEIYEGVEFAPEPESAE